MRRLFHEHLDEVAVRSGPRDAEVRRLVPRQGKHGDRGPRAPGQVCLDHLTWVHPVHVIGPHHHDEVGLVRMDQVQRLVDRVRRAGLPPRSEPLLGWDRRDVVVQQGAQPPGGGDVLVQAVALVLGQHVDVLQPAVDQVGQHEVHHPVHPAEGDRGCGPARRQRPQAGARPARQDQAQDPMPTHLATPRRIVVPLNQGCPSITQRGRAEGPGPPPIPPYPPCHRIPPSRLPASAPPELPSGRA